MYNSVICLLTFALLSCWPAAGRGDDHTRAGLAAGWQAFDRAVRTASIESRIDRFRPSEMGDFVLYRTDRFRSQWSSGGRFSHIEMDVGSKRHVVQRHIANPRYAAELRYKPDADDWILVNLELDESRFTGTSKLRLIAPWLTCANVFLPELFEAPGFSIKRVEDGSRRRRVFFTVEPSRQPKAPAAFAGLESGWIDVDVGSFGQILAFEMSFAISQTTSKHSGEFRYGEKDEIPVVLGQVVLLVAFSPRTGPVSSKEERYYQATYNAAVSDAESRLSNYGLPEPHGVVWERSTPRYVWFLTASAIFGVIALAAHWWRRWNRRQSRS